MIKECDNFTNRIRCALTLPIRTRCAELTVFFDRGSTLELQNFFPTLIDSIFGPNGSISWGLRTPTCVNDDFTQLEHFLSPGGPLFKLIYTLLKDPSAKYDFPVSFLPAKVQQTLQNAQNHLFYSDLLHINPQTKHIISLLLNPFDYYMFHFAYHLINPWHQRSAVASVNVATSWNTVYYVLSCDYIVHFLPPTPTPVTPIIYYTGKSPVGNLQPLQPITGSILINTKVINQLPREEYTNYANNFSKKPRNEIWRSETVLTVFIDMWLTTDQISNNSTQMNSSFNQSATMPRLLQYCELPTSEYMRIVRVLIKQVHTFSASAIIDDTYMRDLKKIAIPMVEGKFYIFLRNLLHKWPLDGSFRLVLELWLTYIQPWRYADELAQNQAKKKCPKKPTIKEMDENQTNAVVDRYYLPFIAANLLCYVVILQQLLPRFTRVDLVSPKIAVMLFRIGKVFNQPNLVSYLQEIEQSIENNHSPSHSFNSHWLNTLPPLNPTTNWCSNTSSVFNNTANEHFPPLPPPTNNTTFMNSLLGDKKWSAIVKQRIFELEGPTFSYKPLFYAQPAKELYDMLVHIKRSIQVAQELVVIKKTEEKEMYGTFTGLIKMFFSHEPKTNIEITLTERLKVPEYLNKSLENFMDIFAINEMPEYEPEKAACSTSGLELGNDLRFLTPQKVRERIHKIRYDGDPDLHPIQTNEVAFLVRMFYQISLGINEKFQGQFCQYYYDPSFWGRLSRQFLSAPMTAYQYDKSKTGSPRIGVNLPPRISLRYFASYRFIRYFLLGAIIFYLFGYNMSIYIIFLVVVYLIYNTFAAITSQSSVRHNYPTQGFGNISFDDSF